MIILELTLDLPLFREPFQSLSEFEIIWEQTSDEVAGPSSMIVWVQCVDFEQFEKAVEADPGSKNPEVITDGQNRRLYQVELTPLAMETKLKSKVNSVGGILRHSIGTPDGWRSRVQVPDREAAEEIYRYYQTADIESIFHHLYEQTEWVGKRGPKLTESQREILIEAIECGYLEIPRETTLAELADRMDISQTAASERFRRAVKNLSQQFVDT